MTTATTEGRRLALRLDGIDEPFLVDPVSARRGKFLTDQFMAVATGVLQDAAVGERIFIEAFGPANYSRASGYYVDVLDGDQVIETYNPSGPMLDPEFNLGHALANGAVVFPREAAPGDEALEGESIRAQEGEALCMAAFYWQSVVGMDGVNEFLSDDGLGGTSGSVKALTLLQIRLGNWTSTNSSVVASEFGTQGDDSRGTSDTPNLSALERLPANKRSLLPRMGKRKRQSSTRA